MKQTKLKLAISIFILCVNIGCLYAKELKIQEFQETTSIEARTNIHYDINGDPTALVIVSLPIKNVKFEGNIVNSSFNISEYKLYLVDGTRKIKILAEGYSPLEVSFDGGLKAKTTYKLKIKPIDNEINFSKHNQFYFDAFFQAGQNMGVGGAIGAYFHAINAEIEFAKGLSKSEKIYWYDKNEQMGSCIYSSWFGNVKLGYGFQFKQRFQVTPQLGVGLLKCTSREDNPAKDANSVFGLIGVRGNFTFGKHLQVTLAPYYNFPIKKSSSFEEIANLQSSIGHWANGFNVKIGVTVFI